MNLIERKGRVQEHFMQVTNIDAPSQLVFSNGDVVSEVLVSCNDFPTVQTPTNLTITPNGEDLENSTLTLFVRVSANIMGYETAACTEVEEVIPFDATEIWISWTAVPNATSYNLYIGSETGVYLVSEETSNLVDSTQIPAGESAIPLEISDFPSAKIVTFGTVLGGNNLGVVAITDNLKPSFSKDIDFVASSQNNVVFVDVLWGSVDVTVKYWNAGLLYDHSYIPPVVGEGTTVVVSDTIELTQDEDFEYTPDADAEPKVIQIYDTNGNTLGFSLQMMSPWKITIPATDATQTATINIIY